MLVLSGVVVQAGVTLATAFPTNNSLADQLKMVARLIGARSTLGSKRQVFMVSIGGFDLHDNLISQQPVLMQQVEPVWPWQGRGG